MMGLRWLLKRFGAFANGYYNYLKDRKSAYRKRKENLLNCITETYHERKGAPGYRLMADQNQSDNLPQIHELRTEIVFCYSQAQTGLPQGNGSQGV